MKITLTLPILGFAILLGGCSKSFFDRKSTLADAPPPTDMTNMNEPSMSMDTLRSLIADNAITTIDALLARLPESYRKYYTLVYDSKSLQSSTADSPRGILYGPDAKFVMTFNGPFAERGNKELEILQYNSSTREFEMYEVEFPEGPGSVNFSAKNPDKCLVCHQSSPRPIWEPYFVWPRVFGSEDDGSIEGSKEFKQTAAFVANYKSMERYRHLLAVADRYAVSFTEPSRLEPEKTLIRYKDQPNMALTFMLFKLNVQRIGKLLVAQEAFKKNKYLVASILSGCLPGFEFDSDSPNPNVPSPEYDQLVRLEPRLEALKSAMGQLDPSTISDEVALSGAAGMLSLANEKLKLGLAVNLVHWRSSLLRPKIKEVIFAPFNDGSGDADVSLYITAASISTLDSDFQGLEDFICPDPTYATVDQKRIYGDHFCSDMTARKQELVAKYGAFEPDGHKMTCKVIAQRWLTSFNLK